MTGRVRSVLHALSCTAFFPAVLAAQQATITGHVRSEAGNPLPGASVAISDLGVGAIARDNGEYSLTVPATRVRSQTVTLSVRLIGYRAKSTQITVNAGAQTQDFVLASNPLQLGEVVITGAGT